MEFLLDEIAIKLHSSRSFSSTEMASESGAEVLSCCLKSK
jgi:hypothetical protein